MMIVLDVICIYTTKVLDLKAVVEFIKMNSVGMSRNEMVAFIFIF